MICKIVKLSNGDTVIGSITEETKVYIEIHRPMRVVVTPKTMNGVANVFQLSMMKWDPLMNYNIPARVFKHSIVSVSEPTLDVGDSYVELYEHMEKNGEANSIDLEDEIELEEDSPSEDSIICVANTLTIH